MIAAHLGVVEEDKIDNMSYLFFEDVLEALGHKLNYDAVVNYAGNAFAENSWDMISDSNPFNVGEDSRKKKVNQSIVDFISKSNVQVGKSLMPKGKQMNTDNSKIKEEG
jgi:hypothetical protein